VDFLKKLWWSCGQRLPKDFRHALEASNSVELLSIHPDPRARSRPEQIHGYDLLGRTLLKRADQLFFLNQLESALKGLGYLIRPKCAFTPRHALRVQTGGETGVPPNSETGGVWGETGVPPNSQAGGRNYDILICYECAEVEFYLDGRRVARDHLRGRPTPDRANQILLKAGATLAPPPPDPTGH
jgi:hypothetical protein